MDRQFRPRVSLDQGRVQVIFCVRGVLAPPRGGAGQLGLSRGLATTMAIGSGLAVANLYYNQPMLADMARTLQVTPHKIGLVATFTQIGYAMGMLLFVP